MHLCFCHQCRSPSVNRDASLIFPLTDDVQNIPGSEHSPISKIQSTRPLTGPVHLPFHYGVQYRRADIESMQPSKHSTCYTNPKVLPMGESGSDSKLNIQRLEYDWSVQLF